MTDGVQSLVHLVKVGPISPRCSTHTLLPRTTCYREITCIASPPIPLTTVYTHQVFAMC